MSVAQDLSMNATANAHVVQTQIPDAGVGLVTNKNINQGEIVYVDRPMYLGWLRHLTLVLEYDVSRCYVTPKKVRVRLCVSVGVRLS